MNKNHTNYTNSNNKTKTDNLLDDSLRSNTDQSMVSEVTFMTYSDEKANIIKEEFFKNVLGQGGDSFSLK